MVAAAMFALAWGAGESVGSLLGVRSVAPHLWRTEVKPVAAASAD